MDDLQQRNTLAEILIGFSLGGLVVISSVVIYFDHAAATTVFSAVLPLFGTWVGTVLAYYFSRSNFAAAATAWKQLSAPGGPKLDDIPATTAMIDRGKIGGLVTVGAGQNEANIRLQADLLSKLSPLITRIPVVDSKGAVKYILHENTLHKFVTKNTPPPAGFDISTATLKMLLDDQECRKLATTFALIGGSATLADAKKRMDETPNCQDIFVTQTGQPDEPMLGWITDATFAGYAIV